MKRLLTIICLSFFITTGYCQTLTIVNLRCESKTNPIGVDILQPAFSWQLRSGRQNVLQTAYRLIVADNLATLQKNTGNIWDSKKINSAASIQITYNGPVLLPIKKYYWKVLVSDNKGNQTWSQPASWQMGLLSGNDWKGAQWIAYDLLPDSNRIVPAAHGNGKKAWGPRKDILPLLRKEFAVTKTIKQATVFICGLGQFEMSINGEKTGDHFLDPGWTQYSKQALYVSFDITKQLKKGTNAIGVMLGNGFYYVPGERYRKITGGYGYPKMICRVVVEYTDGTVSNVISDPSWKTAPSPVIFSSMYGGEDYDAQLEQAGWNKPGFNDRSWKNALTATGPTVLTSQMAEPLKVMEKYNAIGKPGKVNAAWVYDLGQNFSGIPLITLNGKKGDTVRIIPAELLNENGSANQKGSGGPSYFTYILKGNGNETWQPRFTYYGFRYLEVQGASPSTEKNKEQPQILAIAGLHTRNAAATAGSFSCSNDLFNKTWKLIDMAIKSNTVSVFTDCPHREKLGWLEQTHLMGSSVQYNYDIASLCKKVIRDIINAQTPEGLIPEIAPEFVQFEDPFRDSPEWGSAAIILPWYNYQWYGDKITLLEAYDMMERYIGYLQSKAVDNILSQGLGDWYDIGPARPGVSQLTPKGVTATAIYYYDLTMMVDISRLLNKQEDEKKYSNMAAEVKHSFNQKFFDAKTYNYASGSQTANAMALYMKLVEPAYRDSVVSNLVADIRHRNNALTAGDIGYRYVLRALEDAGRSDVIFDMNSRSDVPGYGYQLAHGATALTESWQAYPSVSNNHFMLGHLMEWFYAGLAGIKNADDDVAFHTIDIKPQPVGDIMHAEASYYSVYGLIRSAWKISGKQFELNVTIPPNTTARIFMPGSSDPVNTGSGNYKYTVILK